MKKNQITILIIVLLLLAVLVWLLIPKRSSLSSHTPSVAVAKPSVTNAPKNSSFENALAKYPSFVSNGNTYVIFPSNVVDAIRRRDEERAREDPDRWWKTPVSFYGKVVDENGQAIPQANVKFGLNDISIRGTSEYYTQSDANGLFSLTGVKGKFLGVDIIKEGYYQSQVENNTFNYAGGDNIFNPDRNNPVVFRLHKGGEKVPLIKRDMNVRVKLGETAVVDLLNGKTNSPNGQLRIELLENEREKRGVSEGKCSVRLSVPDGGVQSYTEEFPFVAPETGYESSIQIGMDTGKPPDGWGIRTSRAFFLHTQGLYARALIELDPGGSRFGLDYYINPTGSRNLEPYPGHLYENIDIYNRYAPKSQQATK